MDALELLRSRASNSKLQDPAPDAGTLDEILEAAFRAPDHGAVRPWRVLVVRDAARERLGDVFAELAAESGETPDKIERARRKPLRAPLVLVVAATPREHPKAPEIEQILSAGAVAHGILLGLCARGFAGIWRTGAPAYAPRVKGALGLRAADHIVGFLYVGTAACPAPNMTRPSAGDCAEEWTGEVTRS